MTPQQLINIAGLARQHATNAQNDIINASTRIEHQRLTMLAIEADNVARNLEYLASLNPSEEDTSELRVDIPGI
jgi:hypothetical protein